MYRSILPLLSILSLATAQGACGGTGQAGYCNITSITDVFASTSSPPTTSQCEDTCQSINSDGGDWGVDFTGQPDGYIDTFINFPCTFAAGRGAGEPLDYSFDMTNSDITGIINAVNVQFGEKYGGKVAAQGTMECQGKQATWFVN